MSFFNNSVPLFRPKQRILDIQDLQGLWYVQWQLGSYRLYSAIYTNIDRVYLLWALLLLLMFLTAQFLPISWQTQAIVWTVFSSIATGIMVRWSRFWVSVERVEWVLYFWVVLMLAGLIITDLGIFLAWTPVLCNLCSLWLSLGALGYFASGLAVRSRAVIAVGIFHLLVVLVLPYVEGWQFLLTGLTMAACLLLLAELQWDMRLPICDARLTPQQKQFNQQQQRLRSV